MAARRGPIEPVAAGRGRAGRHRAHDHAHAHEDLAPHGGRYENILEAIGHTPLVAIPRMSPNPKVRIFAKLEFVNPTGSVKDRVARYLIEDLEARGRPPARTRSSSSRPRATPASPWR